MCVLCVTKHCLCSASAQVGVAKINKTNQTKLSLTDDCQCWVKKRERHQFLDATVTAREDCEYVCVRASRDDDGEKKAVDNKQDFFGSSYRTVNVVFHFI